MNDAGFTVRRLTAEDIGLMRETLGMLGEAFEEVETFTSRPPSEVYLRRLLGKPDFVALAAIQGGEVIGGLMAYELQKFEQERSEFYIYDLAVREDCRRRGVGTALINALKPIAAASGGYVIFVQADYADEPAVALYTKLGAREDVMHFDIGVG